MAKYVKHSFDEGKYQCPICEYGHGEGNGKSRQAVSAHFNKTHGEQSKGFTLPPSDTATESHSEPPSPSPPLETEDDVLEAEVDEIPDWYSVDFGEEDEATPTSSIPNVAMGFLEAMGKGAPKKKSGSAMKEWFAQQAKVVRWGFAGIIDPLFSWWGRGATMDPSFTVQRTEKEWAMMENITSEWLEYRQISLPITPDVMMLGCIGALYAPVVVKVQRNRHPSKKGVGILRKFKAWRIKRKMKKVNPLNEEAFE